MTDHGATSRDLAQRVREWREANAAYAPGPRNSRHDWDNETAGLIDSLYAEVQRLTPPTITTTAELEALPPETVIKAATGEVYVGKPGPDTSALIALPAIVLYLPKKVESDA